MKSISHTLFPALALLFLTFVCTSVRAQCDTAPTTTRACDDGDPTTINDIETILDADGTVCIPCTGTPFSVCDDPVALIDLEANAVQARLTTNGSLWNGTYVVTNDEDSPNVNPVNAIRNGAFWIAGRDPGGTLFVRAPLEGNGPGSYGYLPGPLIDGQTSADTCASWDRFFVVTAEEVERHRQIYWDAIDNDNMDLPLPLDSIPASILGWPGAGNPQFSAQNGFPLHDTPEGLAPFYDENLNGIYEPTYGDRPFFCGAQGIWSVFNTGKVTGTSATGQLPLQISVMASAPNNADPDLQRTTFYTYTVRNFGQEDLVDAYVGHFINSALGCADNDRTESDPEARLFYVYNDTASEENCAGGEAGYGQSNPVNLFQVIGSRFPEDFQEQRLYGIQSYQTFYDESDAGFPAVTYAPTTPNEVYNSFQSRWRDGSPLVRGGNGYDQPGWEETRFAFDGVETNGTPWNSRTSGVPATHVRSLYGIGQFNIRSGRAVSFTLAVTTLFDVAFTDENCPDRAVIRERAWEIESFFNEGCRPDPEPVSTPDPATAVGLEVFPNPTREFLRFSLPETEHAERVELIDLTGRVVVSVTPSDGNIMLNVSELGLKSGPYFYRLYTASERLVTGKVVVQR